jgi:hypothetical protein
LKTFLAFHLLACLTLTSNATEPNPSQRDWEKYPPITDSDVIKYEEEKNVPMEERFETQERLDMEEWYKQKVIKTILQNNYSTPKSQKKLLKKTLKNIEEEQTHKAQQDAMVKATLKLFQEVFPESDPNDLVTSLILTQELSPKLQKKLSEIQ